MSRHDLAAPPAPAAPPPSAPAATRTAPPPSAPSPARRPAGALAFAVPAMLVSYLPFSASNAGLGAIARSTGASTQDLQGVSDAFAVALSAVVLSAGTVADRYGRRRTALAGLALTLLGTLADLVAGLATSGAGTVRLLWLGQAVAGVGGGAVMSATLGLVAAAAPDARARARWISAWAAAVVLGLGLGPFLAAAVTTRAGWPWLYLPIAGAALVAALPARACAESRAPVARGLDVPGQLAAVVAVAAGIYGTIRGGGDGWTSAGALGAYAVCVPALVAFVVLERRAADPVLHLQLFASRGFDAAGLAAAATLFTLAGGMFLLSLLFAAQHVDATGIALRLGCLFAGNAVASLAAGALLGRAGARTLMAGGLAVAAAGAASLLTASATDGLAAWSWRLAVTGVGAGLVMATTSTVAVTAVPAADAGLAGAANNALRQLGAALGPALLGALATGRLRAGASWTAALHLCMSVTAGLLALAAAVTLLLLPRRQA